MNIQDEKKIEDFARTLAKKTKEEMVILLFKWNRFEETHFKIDCEVTHWMQLPELP